MQICSVIIYPLKKKFIGTSSILARGKCRVLPTDPICQVVTGTAVIFHLAGRQELPVCLSFEYNLQCPLLVPHLFPPHHLLFHWLRLLPYLHLPYIQVSDIDLFTDTAAILDYLDLRSIMGWPGGAWAPFHLLVQYLRALSGLYYYVRNFCNLIGLEQWYFSLIWNTYMWKLQNYCR